MTRKGLLMNFTRLTMHSLKTFILLLAPVLAHGQPNYSAFTNGNLAGFHATAPNSVQAGSGFYIAAYDQLLNKYVAAQPWYERTTGGTPVTDRGRVFLLDDPASHTPNYDQGVVGSQVNALLGNTVAVDDTHGLVYMSEPGTNRVWVCDLGSIMGAAGTPVSAMASGCFSILPPHPTAGEFGKEIIVRDDGDLVVISAPMSGKVYFFRGLHTQGYQAPPNNILQAPCSGRITPPNGTDYLGCQDRLGSTNPGPSAKMGWSADFMTDLNQDGHPEIAVGVPDYSIYYQYWGAVAVLDGHSFNLVPNGLIQGLERNSKFGHDVSGMPEVQGSTQYRKALAISAPQDDLSHLPQNSQRMVDRGAVYYFRYMPNGRFELQPGMISHPSATGTFYGSTLTTLHTLQLNMRHEVIVASETSEEYQNRLHFTSVGGSLDPSAPQHIATSFSAFKGSVSGSNIIAPSEIGFRLHRLSPSLSKGSQIGLAIGDGTRAHAQPQSGGAFHFLGPDISNLVMAGNDIVSTGDYVVQPPCKPGSLTEGLINLEIQNFRQGGSPIINVDYSTGNSNWGGSSPLGMLHYVISFGFTPRSNVVLNPRMRSTQDQCPIGLPDTPLLVPAQGPGQPLQFLGSARIPNGLAGQPITVFAMAYEYQTGLWHTSEHRQVIIQP